MLRLCGSLYNGICIDNPVESCECLGNHAKTTAGIGLLVEDSADNGLSLLPSKTAP